VIAFAHDERVQQQLALWWGVHALQIKFQPDIESLMAAVEQGLRSHAWVRRHDRVVVLASSPVRLRSQVNFLKVLEIA
jgi:pyruvate kinase